MASSYKTPHLGLNKWIGSDKPKRMDFVEDNTLIDESFKKHVEDESHITDNERKQWNQATASTVFFGEYTGNGYTTREIQTGFPPSFVVVFQKDSLPFVFHSLSNSMKSSLALGMQGGSTLGLVLSTKGFTVSQPSSLPSDGLHYRMNEAGKVYCYMVMR